MIFQAAAASPNNMANIFCEQGSYVCRYNSIPLSPLIMNPDYANWFIIQESQFADH
jgi:hypothetical protein